VKGISKASKTSPKMNVFLIFYVENILFFSVNILALKAGNYAKYGCFTLIYEDFRAVIQEK